MATSQLEVIKKFMASLDNTTLSGVSALDEAIRACSDFGSANEAIKQMVEDCRNAASADVFLKDYCGIILDNEDTGAITGSDAGGSTVKTAESIVPEEGSLTTYPDNSFTANGLTFQLTQLSNSYDYDSHYTSLSYYSLSDKQKFMWNGLYSWWAESSLNLIAESYGDNFGFGSNSSATVKTIHVGFEYDSSGGWLASVLPWTDMGETEDLDLRINTYYYNNVDTTNENGYTSSFGAGYLDRTLAHELTHAVMAANIKNFSRLPQFIKEGMAELTHGIDDHRTSTITTLAGNSSTLSAALDLTNSGTGTEYAYAGGYMFLRYLAKQAAESIPVIFTEGADNYSNYTSDTLLSALGGNDTVYNYADKVTIDGGNDDDYLYSESNYNTVIGGKDNDTISLSSSSANNIIQYASGDGNDIIYGFNNDDTLEITSGSYTTIISDNDLLVSVGSSSITLKDTSAANIKGTRKNTDSGSIIFNYRSNTVISGTDFADTVGSFDSSNVTINSGAGNDIINNFSSAAVIKSDSGNDSIFNNGDNVTIVGGIGDDYISLSSSTGNLIQYASGNGNDTIVGFDSNDVLQITSGKYSTVTNNNDVVVKVGDGSIILRDAKDKTINITGTISGGDSGNTLPSGLSLNSSKTILTASKKFKGSAIDLTKYPKVKTLKASAVTKNLQVVGNSLNNSIVGGKKADIIDGGIGNDTLNGGAGSDSLKGGKGNDVLIGGTGNDTLSGGAGTDIFIHSGGKDVITDYTSADYIKLKNVAIVSSKVTGKNVILTTSNGSITIQNGKGKDINFITTQKYSNIADDDLFDEEDFATAEDIDTIVENNFVGEFEFTTARDTLQSSITFADS